MTTGALDDDRLTALGLLVEAHQGLTERLSGTLADHGLSGNEFEVLLRVGRTPGRQLRMSDLATQTSLTTSGVTRVVDRLETRALVRRVTCDSDRRGTWATITESGLRLAEETVRDHLVDVDRWFTGRLTADQLAALTDALRVIRDAVRPGSTAGITAGVAAS